MIFILIFMWSGIIEHKAFAQETSDPSETELKKAADQLERLFAALKEALQEFPKDSFDPESIIQKIGNDPTRLFEWVRDNTCLIPYRGSLRGSLGVAMDRLGNSLDRSLLLYELINLAGYDARLARGTLSKTEAKDLLSNITSLTIMHSTSPENEPVSEDIIEKYAEKYQLNLAGFRKTVEETIEDQKDMAKKFHARVENQTKAVLKAIGKSKNIIESEYLESQLKKLQDHWWVQYRGENAWINLDPSLRDYKPNESMTKLEEYCIPEEIDEDLFHSVDIRIILESWENGSLEENTVLQHQFLTSNLVGKQILLQHYPMSWPDDMDLLQEKNPIQRLRTEVLKQEEWLPILSIESKRISSASFMDTGEINETPGNKSKASGVTRVTGGLLRAMAGNEEKKKDSLLTAEWIEFEIHVPGESAKKIHRQIFDLVGPAIRQEEEVPKPEINETQKLNSFLALIGETEIFVQASLVAPNFYSYLMAKNLLAYADVLPNMLRLDDLSKGKELIEKASQLPRLPGQGYIFALARQNWSNKRSKIYLDRPIIINFHRGLQQKSHDEWFSYSAFDIVANEIGVIRKSSEDLFEVRLEQGISDTNTEGILMGRYGESVENCAEIFDQAISQQIKLLTIKDSTDPIFDKLKLSENTKTRIEKDLFEGYLIIIPEKEVIIKNNPVIAWWRLEPNTGNILGISENGWGQAMAEYNITKLLVSFAAFSNCMVAGIISELDRSTIRMSLKMAVCVVQACWPGFGSMGREITRAGLVNWLLGMIVGSFAPWIPMADR